MSEIYLIRHGQASFGSDNYDQLSELGFVQSRLLGEHFAERGLSFDHLIAGDMQRHHQTLDGICEGMQMRASSPYRVHVGFNEYNFQQMTAAYGRHYPEDELYLAALASPGDKTAYYRLLRRVLTAWSENRIDDIPETWAQFEQRVLDARGLIHELADRGSRVLVASSGGAISMFIGSVLGLPPEKVFELNLQIHNTSIHHFYFNRQKISLSGFNGIPHLDHPQRSDYITYG